MTPEPTPALAAENLAHAADAATRLRSQTRWRANALIIGALFYAAVLLIAGLLQGRQLRQSHQLWPAELIILPLAVDAILLWILNSRQRVFPRNRNTGDRPYQLGTFLLAIAALLFGARHEGILNYWLPAAIISTLPVTYRAWRVYRA